MKSISQKNICNIATPADVFKIEMLSSHFLMDFTLSFEADADFYIPHKKQMLFLFQVPL